ncbi:MAG: TIGR03905 family TSCPD domain-containing protein [Oscillospiraceae bacterium]|nr:TIGR03905 family TSCPD domain-containing protein [Oscillospiraceae bacterium]
MEFSLVHTGDVITISDVVFTGGCAGNAKGIAALVEGLSVDEVISTLEDVPCGNRGTSCPAQLALALREALDAD